MIKAIIFDCFGVLRPDVLHRAYRRLGGDDQKDADFIADTLYASHTGKITSSSPVFAEHLGVSLEAWQQAITGESNDQELLDYITKLRKTYKTGVLSNIGKGGLLRYFTQAEIDAHFDVVVASGEIGFAKPEPEAYEITAERLGVRLDECVFTDDREVYCEAAQGVGMQTIVYYSFDQFRVDLENLLT